MKYKLRRFSLAFLCVFLLAFMLLIFGPAEIFFANQSQFDFVYGEFAWALMALALAASLGVALIVVWLPERLGDILQEIFFGVGLAGYIQIMFLNKGLDLLGLNPDGYQVSFGVKVSNLIVWLVIILGVVFFCCFKKQMGKKLCGYGCGVLICMQLAGMISLLLTAPVEAYEHPSENWFLSGEKQYTVSADENVIVILLDYFSNEDLQEAEAVYPGLDDFMNDFTYYSNAGCNYYGTFPSIAHFLSGHEVDPSIPVNEWFYKIWTDGETEAFYNELEQKGFVSHLYTPDLHHISGTNNPVILKEEFDNLINSSQTIDVHYKLLWKTMIKMACYRFVPESMKNLFYTDGGEYGNIIAYLDSPIDHYNHEFHEYLLEDGLKVDEENKYFVIQHLVGPHEYNTNEYGFLEYDAGMVKTIKGCMVILEEYLTQLKALGVYDNSTIIVTSDHGDVVDSQVIFYIKEKDVRTSEMTTTNAPITLAEMRATIANAVGIDTSRYGSTIYDFHEDEERERSVWVRQSDERYIIVDNYAEDRIGYANIYNVYTYMGDAQDLYKTIEDGPDDVKQMVDSFY